MRHFIAVVALVVAVATGACSVRTISFQPDAPPSPPDVPPPPDAPPDPFACNNKPLPPVDSMQVTVTGTVKLALSNMIASNVTIQAFLNTTNPAEQGELQHTTTDSNGSFTMQLATGGGRVDAYLKATASGFLDNYVYPAYPVGGDKPVQVDLRLFKAAELTLLTGGMGVTLKSGEAVFLVAAVDCNEKQLGNVTVSTDPPGDGTIVHYFVDSPSVMPSQSARVTDGTTGVAIAANVPVGPTTIGGTVPSPDDHSRTLTMFSHMIVHPVAGALIQTELAP